MTALTRLLYVTALVCSLAAIVLASTGHAASTPSNVGDGGSSLPACTASLAGSVFYSAGHYWRCVASPYRMVIVG